MTNTVWHYPEAPVENLYGSHGMYDEAEGPQNPNGRLIPIEEISDEDVEDDFDQLDWTPPEVPRAPQAVRYFSNENDWGPDFDHRTTVVTKVYRRKRDRFTGRWVNVPMFIALTIRKKH